MRNIRRSARFPRWGSRHRRPHIIDRYERQAGRKCGLAAGVEPVGRRAAGCRDGRENDVGEGPATHGHLTRLPAGCEVIHSLAGRFCRDRGAAGGPSDHRWILSTHVRAWRRVRLPTAPPTVNAPGRDEMSAIGTRCTPRPGAWTIDSGWHIAGG